MLGRRLPVAVLGVALLLAASASGVPADAAHRVGRHYDDLDVSVTRAPVDPDGDLAGAETDLVVTFRDADPTVPGVGLRAGGTVRVRLPDGFVNGGVLPVASTGSTPDCEPPLVTGCSTAVLLQGWPQSPVLPFPDVTWEAATNTVVVTATADWLPAGTAAPGPKQVHLMLFGFTNPEHPGRYRVSVEIQPDPGSDEVLRGSGRVRIGRRTRPSVNPNSQANGSPPPPFPNTLVQWVRAGDPSLTLAFYLWDRDTNAYVGVDFPAGSDRIRPLRDADGRRIGFVRVRPPRRARNWSLESGGPSTVANAFVTGIPTGRMTAVLQTDPAVTGTYQLTFRLFRGNSVRHTIHTDHVGGDGVLTIGTIFPVTGNLSLLGPAEIYGAQLAVDDINEASGVFGTDVVLEQGDSGDTADIANTEVDRLLGQNADAIIGAASSGVSLTVIDKITNGGVIQFSPANTSPIFTTYDDNGLYFRTAPSDLLQGRTLANQVIEQGNKSASVLFRQDSYGQGLADFFTERFEGLGGTIDEFISYADADSFDFEVDQLVAAGSDAIIIIGFQESATILTTMHERGIGPTSDTNVWGVDGNDNIDNLVADASILEGMKQTFAAVDPSSIPEFITRLESEIPVGATTAYGAGTYDAIIIVALAAELASSDDGAAIAAEINGVTKGGDKCTTFAECKAIISSGGDPDYDGLGGPYEFIDAGEPGVASFRVQTYGIDGRDETLDVYIFVS